MLSSIKNINGQSSLEFACAMVILAVLLVAILRIFVWINTRIIQRQAYYEGSRVTATEDATVGVYNEPAYPDLDILGGF